MDLGGREDFWQQLKIPAPSVAPHPAINPQWYAEPKTKDQVTEEE